MTAAVAVAHQRTLQGRTATLRVDIQTGDGDLDPAPGTVTVGVTRADATTLISAGTATTTPTDRAWRRTVALTVAQTASLDRLTATWKVGSDTIATTLHEIVGGWWVTLADLRNVDGLAQVDPDTLADQRDAFEALAEDAMGVAYVPRHERETLWGSGTSLVVLAWSQVRAVDSITIDDVAQTVTDWDIDGPSGVLVAPRAIASTEQVVVAYRHGYDRPDPALRRAALTAIRFAVVGDAHRLVSPRARSISGELGTIDLTYAGRDRPTGLPEVDALLMSRSRRTPGVG